MAQLSDVVEISVSANTRTPSQAGFGTPLALAYHTLFAENYRVYSDIDGLVSDGAASEDPIYLMALAAFAQDPKPQQIMVGRLPAAHTHTQTVTITDATEGNHIQFQVRDTLGVWQDIDYTILAAATTTTVATAVELLIEAFTGVSSISAAAVITVTPAANGDVIYLRGPDGSGAPVGCTFAETTPDANYDDQLSAIYAQTKAFYGITLDTNSETNVDLVAAWAEARTVLFGYQTQNHAEKAGSGTLASGLQTLAYDRTFGVFADDMSQYQALGWMSLCFAKEPGSITWKFKTVAGASPPVLTDSQETNLKAVNLNFAVNLNAINFMTEGKCADGTFIDIRHGTDALTARVQEAVFGDLVNADKIAFEDGDIDGICGTVLSVLRKFENVRFLAKNTSTCTAPKAADIDDVDKAARTLPDVKFGAVLAGAVHKVRIAGVLSLS